MGLYFWLSLPPVIDDIISKPGTYYLLKAKYREKWEQKVPYIKDTFLFNIIVFIHKA